jgi:uncharacterized repeat protein (TIGR03803 family)
MKPESLLTRCKLVLVFALAVGTAVVMIPLAQAQTFSVVHDFTGGSDGSDPLNGFTIDANGNLYGTASSGGAYKSGVVFKVTEKGKEIVLYPFTGGVDGGGPNGSLIRSATGVLYGTTTAGGVSGAGTVFKVVGKKETVLYSFTGGADGGDPQAGLTVDAVGNLYGTTSSGGASGIGAVFRLSHAKKESGKWTETVLYSFDGGTDGATPVGGVSFDSAGNLYGTTSAGGAYGLGTIFQLEAGEGWKENILHSFEDANDGAVPYAGLLPDTAGNFYGAATEGGSGGGGTVFELTPSNGSWNFTVVYSVPGWGISGSFRDLVLDGSGNIYGTTHCDGEYNSGTVYELTPKGSSWTYTLLYTFTGGSDGLYSFSNLVLNQGKLYGTTKYGGEYSNGVIFEVTP